MNNYTRMSLAGFAERLKASRYKTITAARRAIGKSHWTKPQRIRAHTIADDHFAAGPTTSKRTKPTRGKPGRKPRPAARAEVQAAFDERDRLRALVERIATLVGDRWAKS